MNYDDILATAEWGRTNELCRLHAMLRAAKAKRFGVILLTGSRGSGKNYLVNQVGFTNLLGTTLVAQHAPFFCCFSILLPPAPVERTREFR